MSDVNLRVDWCSYEAAKYAVEHWHYSRTMPVSKRVHVGAWENDDFIGAVIFSWGANPNIGKPYKLATGEICELVRIALREHKCFTSRVVSVAVKMLSSQSPGLRLLVSYADQREGHVGAIYQALNWIYTGETDDKKDLMLGDMILHRRSYTGRNFDGGRRRPPSGAVWVESPPKYRYLYPLDRAMRRQIEPLRKPYPKRVPSVHGDTVGDQPTEAGSSPAARSDLYSEVAENG